jgi:hypothetical protein
MNPFFKRLEENRIGKSGRASEKQTAKRLKGKQTPASGAMPSAKGDIELPEFLLEAKSTVSESISLKRAWLKKIGNEALGVNKYPAVSIIFNTEDGVPKHRGSWVLITEDMFRELTDK